MQKGNKMKAATHRVAAANRRASRQNTKMTFWKRVWNIICIPFQILWRGIRHIWQWIRSIDLVGLVNITLLVAIIVMFSILIMDILKFKKSQIIVVPAQTVEITADNYVTPKRKISPRPKTTALPIKHDANRKMVTQPVHIVPTPAPTIKVAQDSATRIMYGDIIIDNRGDATILHDGAQIQGNLYLQNMRKYTLPCDIKIDGNLFLRDLNMLQFCGDFTITGNIYVSPRSSFGPIPRTARLGGRVIL